MGLDTSHDCWHGAYSEFMRWRTELARVAGLPPLELMDGFYEPLDSKQGNPSLRCGFYHEKSDQLGSLQRLDESLPISWDCLKPDALYILLHHSDCEGEIEWKDCESIADSLEALIPKLHKGDAGGHIGNWRDTTQQFVDGLRDAASKKENVNFH